MSNVTQRKVSAKQENVVPTQEPIKTSISESENRSSKFKEPPPQLRGHKVFVRMVLASAVFIIVYFTSNKEKSTTLAGYREFVSLREHKISCLADSFTLSEIENFPKCISYCKRFVTDNLISENEISLLQDIEARLFPHADDSSRIYKINSNFMPSDEVTKNIHEIIKSIQPKIIENIAQRFEISHNSLYLTSPTQFSKITNITNEYSESMHRLRYDKESNKHVHYSVIIFLSSYKRNFNGGRFLFVDYEKKKKKSNFIDPKVGRIVVYSAGEENSHIIENILNGHLSALSLSFTCDKEAVLLLK